MAVKIIKKEKVPFKVYRFGSVNEGNASMKEVLGGKGANLAEMVSLGVSVPPGFIIPCEASITYQDTANDAEKRKDFLVRLMKAVASGVQYLETEFGYMPLVSVRSGARVSMPGMMDTILNVGLTSASLPEWEARIGARAARDSMRRLMQMYGSVAMGLPMESFEKALAELRESAGVKTDAELSEDHLSRLLKRYTEIYTAAGKVFPDDFASQLTGAIRAVFESWNNPRAIEYRKINSIPYGWGTAVSIQAMVFGNFNEKSCTGVMFTRDPSTGKAAMTGDWLPDAQGEDVVAGIRDTEKIDSLVKWNGDVYVELMSVATKLEGHYKDMQDIEFTVQDGKLYILQTRNGKRSAAAAFKIAHDMCGEGVISKKDAVSRVNRAQLMSAMSDSIDPTFKIKPSLVGVAAGGGVVTGRAMFSSSSAVSCKDPCILVTKETDPDDIAGMNAAIGILTATGGMTSHAAVVARGMNKACVVGATNLSIPKVTVSPPTAIIKDGVAFVEGDTITIDGSTGNVWVNTKVPVIQGGVSVELSQVVAWALEDIGDVAERVDINGSMPYMDVSKKLSSVVSPKVYIDTAAIEYGCPGQNEVASLLSMVGEDLKLLPFKEVVIDMRPLSAYAPKVDVAFGKMFALHDVSQATDLVKASALCGWPSTVIERTLVLAPQASKEVQNKLTLAGFKIVGLSINTFADLLSASGGVQASDEVIQKVFGGKKAYLAAVDMVEKQAGKSLSSAVPVPMYWYESIEAA